MVDTTDLKSVEACPRAGSSPAFRTKKALFFRVFFLSGKKGLIPAVAIS